MPEMPPYPLLSWVLINPTSSKTVSVESVLPTSGTDWGGALADEYEMPVQKLSFRLSMAPDWKRDEVLAAHNARMGIYSLTDVKGEDYEGPIEQVSWPAVEGTEFTDLTITMLILPEEPA
jgi:hypothetical protein